MEVFRICIEQYSKALVASGKSARWNKDNQFVLYTGQSRSLSTLESIVHKSSISTALNYKVMVISIAENENLYTKKLIQQLPKDWQTENAYLLQEIGSDWYSRGESLILQVPSVIIPQEFNYIINTNHPDFKANVSLIKTEDYFWDNRLF